MRVELIRIVRHKRVYKVTMVDKSVHLLEAEDQFAWWATAPRVRVPDLLDDKLVSVKGVVLNRRNLVSFEEVVKKRSVVETRTYAKVINRPGTWRESVHLCRVEEPKS